MNKFSRTSQKRLDSCHKDLQTLFNEVLKYHDICIICGERGEVEQNMAYDEGNSTLKYPQSKHNQSPSLAVDVALYHKDKPHIHWFDEQEWLDFGRFVFKVIGHLKDKGLITSDISWGGHWTKPKDYPHWQIK